MHCLLHLQPTAALPAAKIEYDESSCEVLILKNNKLPVAGTVPAITVICAVLSVFLVAFEFGYTADPGLYIRLSPDFFEGGFRLMLRLVAISVPVSMLFMSVFIRKADPRLMMLPTAMSIVYGIELLAYYIRMEMFTGTTIALWVVCRYLLPLAFAFILFLTLNGTLKKPFVSALASAGALLLSFVTRVICAIIDRSVTSEFLPEALYYLAMAAFVMSLEFPHVEKEVQFRYFAGTPDQFCPEWEDGDLPEELCEHEDITACVLISVMTLGLYQLVWLHRLCKKVKLLAGEPKDSKKELAMIALVPFYLPYWMFTRGKKLSENAKKLNIHLSNNGAFYMLFSLCGLSVFAVAMMQKDFNRIARRLEQTVSAAALKNEEDRRQGIETPADRTANAEKEEKQAFDTVTLLHSLKQLRSMDILTEEEYKEKKQKLLNQF